MSEQSIIDARSQEHNKVFFEIILLTLIRLVMNSANRMVYPFMPAFSRGMNISASSGRLLISARSIAGGLSFLFGPTSDRFGRRNVMLVALGIFTIALLTVPLAPFFGVVFVVFILIGLAKAIFDPTLQAFAGDAVPYKRRGLAIGIIETAWSGSLLVSIPLIGFFIEKYGWESPFYVLAAFSLVGMVFIALKVPQPIAQRGAVERFSILHAWRLLNQYPASLQAIAFSFVVHVANESIFVVYGEWMEGTFGLKIGILGILTVVVGIAELIGEFIVILGADRVGKKAVTVFGILLASGCYIVFPLIGGSLWISLVVLFFMFVAWEAGIVASITLFSEQLPERRGTMMASNVTAISIGRVVGALVGGLLWETAGFGSNGLFAGVLNIFAVAILLRKIKG